jgi:hypothetical protein
MAHRHRIYIKPAINNHGQLKATKRGPQYEATYNGEIICVSHQPFFDGARVLRDRGLTGQLEMWDHERPFPRMRSTIEKAAQLTVVEGRNTEIRIAKWKAPDDRLRGLNVERRKSVAGSSGTSNHETASDGVTAEDAEPIPPAGSAAEEDVP